MGTPEGPADGARDRNREGNYDVLEASKLASRAASISVTRHGVVDAIPSLNEVLKK